MADPETYFVGRDSLYLRRRGSTTKHQFVVGDEVPADFLPEDEDVLRAMVDAGQLVTTRPVVEERGRPPQRVPGPGAMTRLGPTVSGIFRDLGMRFRPE